MQAETTTGHTERRGALGSALAAVSPSATDLIRMDHTKVLAAFHRYRIDTPPAQKQALVNTITLLLETHATLEEEIFYPALVDLDPELIQKSLPEHEEMKELVAALRDIDPSTSEYDEAVMALMRTIIHHVADEETMLLPDAERALGDRVSELGARMTSRKLVLLTPRLPALTVNAVRALPASRMFVYGAAALAVAVVFKRAFGARS